MHSFCENLGSLCICQLASIKYTQALTDYRVFRWHSSKKISGISHFGNCRTAPPPAGGFRVGNLHSGEKDFLNFRFILETAGPGGQVTKWSGDHEDQVDQVNEEDQVVQVDQEDQVVQVVR